MTPQERQAEDKRIFDKFREMAGGRLTVEQVNALNAVLYAGHREDIKRAFEISDDVYMTTSLAGMNLVAGFEGFRDKAYRDSAGIPTIGFGTTRYPNGERVKMGDKCTRAEALLWKQHDIKDTEKWVNEIIKVPLKQHQFDALVSFVYNIGPTAFRDGSVDDYINKGDLKSATEVWAKYNKARVSGKLTVIKGLDNRRKAEIAYFLNG